MSISIKIKEYPKELVYKLEPDKFYPEIDMYGNVPTVRSSRKWPDYRLSMTHDSDSYELFCMVNLTEIDGILNHIDWDGDEDDKEYVREGDTYIEYLQLKLKDKSVVEKIRQYIIREELEIEIELY